MILTHTVQEEIPIFPVIPCQVLLKEGLEEVLDLVELECTEGIRLAGTDHLEMLISVCFSSCYGVGWWCVGTKRYVSFPYAADRRQQRSRSPPTHYDTGRFPPRNGRSQSPPRDRFLDRERRDREPMERDDRSRYREDRREPNYIGGRGIDPDGLENMVSFRHFSEWLRFSQPELVAKDDEEAKNAKPGKKSGMSLRFEEYKKSFTSRQVRPLGLDHIHALPDKSLTTLHTALGSLLGPP